MVFLKLYDKYQKILQKSHIYIIIQKKYFQQITPKPTNQTLNINFDNALPDIPFLNWSYYLALSA